jgi:hypothetical protein
MLNLNSIYKTTLWKFVVWMIFYSIASLVGFFLTTGGWSGFWVFFVALPFFGVFLLVLLILAVFLHQSGKKFVYIPTIFFLILLILQIVLLLINPGDCGDAGGSYLFIQSLIKPDVCDTVPHALTIIEVFKPIIERLMLPLLLLYAFLLSLLTLKILFSSSKKK